MGLTFSGNKQKRKQNTTSDLLQIITHFAFYKFVQLDILKAVEFVYMSEAVKNWGLVEKQKIFSPLSLLLFCGPFTPFIIIIIIIITAVSSRKGLSYKHIKNDNLVLRILFIYIYITIIVYVS